MRLQYLKKLKLIEQKGDICPQGTNIDYYYMGG